MLRNSKGISLLEIMIWVVILMLCAAIAIPNIRTLRDNANVKDNMRIAKIAMVSFGLRNNGPYATGPSDATPDGQTVEYQCPEHHWPRNPITGERSQPTWGSPPNKPGEFGFTVVRPDSFIIEGCGKDGRLLEYTLTSAD